jgi:hypothetical protein
MYLSDHSRLVKLENKMKALAAVLHPDILSSEPITLSLGQTLGRVGDFAYTADEILQAMDLWIEPDSRDDHAPRKVLELIHHFDTWKHYSEK